MAPVNHHQTIIHNHFISPYIYGHSIYGVNRTIVWYILWAIVSRLEHEMKINPTNFHKMNPIKIFLY